MPVLRQSRSFANQTLASEYLLSKRGELNREVYRIPGELDREIASLKLKRMGVEIDLFTPEREGYLSSWTMEA